MNLELAGSSSLARVFPGTNSRAELVTRAVGSGIILGNRIHVLHARQGYRIIGVQRFACLQTDMATFRFGLLAEPETRKPSKVRLVLFILVILLLILSVAFIALYVVEKTKSNETQSGTCRSAACITSAAGMLSQNLVCV